jgi:hypothetical protein
VILGAGIVFSLWKTGRAIPEVKRDAALPPAA